MVSQRREKKGAAQAAMMVTPRPPFTFSLLVALEPKWVSGLEHVVGSCFWFSVFFFLIPSAILCLLVGEFNPFKFKAIAHKERLISAILAFVSVYLR